MDLDGAGSGSSSISSPPGSPPPTDTIHVARLMNSRPNLPASGLSPGVVPPNPASSVPHADPRFGIGLPTPQPNTTTASTTPNASALNGAPAEKPKRQRKKKEVGPDGKPIDDGKTKPKAPRKPREPKDKTAPGASTTATAARKKKADTATPPVMSAPSSTAPRQPTITEMVSSFPAPAPPSSAISAPRASQPPPPVDTTHRLSSLPPPSSTQSPTQRPQTHIKMEPERMYDYDPVRGTYTAKASRAPSNPPPVFNNNSSAYSAPPPAQPAVGRASTSASIASLIDPPSAAKPAPSPLSHSPKPPTQPFALPHSTSPQPPRTAPAAAQPSISSITAPPLPSKVNGEKMDIDLTCETTVKPPPQVEVKAPSKASSAAPTPKVAPSRPTPPPVGTGSGLLSSSDLFGGPAKDDGGERQGVNIDIEIKLNPSGGNTINIAQEILKKYGADAINPRAAAHRARLLKIAAAANKIDPAGGDDMSVDLMSDMDGDSNVEMGGMDDGKSGADGNDTKPKKRRKIEDYDKEDDFIDDTELAWQEQAAVAKDGFFVYSGPLVPAGELAQVESSAPTRGRGRGRAARARAAASSTTHASVAEKKEGSALPARGRGSRGGARGTGLTRKPRITKADRERRETEKIQRERAAANLSGPTGAPLTLSSTPAATTATAQPTYQLPTTSLQQVSSTTA